MFELVMAGMSSLLQHVINTFLYTIPLITCNTSSFIHPEVDHYMSEFSFRNHLLNGIFSGYLYNLPVKELEDLGSHVTEDNVSLYKNAVLMTSFQNILF